MKSMNSQLLKQELRKEGFDLLISENSGTIEVELKNTLNGSRVGIAKSEVEEVAIYRLLSRCLGKFASYSVMDFEITESLINVDTEKL